MFTVSCAVDVAGLHARCVVHQLSTMAEKWALKLLSLMFSYVLPFIECFIAAAVVTIMCAVGSNFHQMVVFLSLIFQLLVPVISVASTVDSVASLSSRITAATESAVGWWFTAEFVLISTF